MSNKIGLIRLDNESDDHFIWRVQIIHNKRLFITRYINLRNKRMKNREYQILEYHIKIMLTDIFKLDKPWTTTRYINNGEYCVLLKIKKY